MRSTIATLQDVVEALRGEYTEQGGRYVLKLEGAHPAVAEAVGTANTRITELTTKVDEFRATNVRILKAIGADNVEGAMAKLETFAKIDPVKYQALVDKAADFEKKGLTKGEDFAALMTKAVQDAVGPLNARLDASEKARTDSDDALANEKLRGTLTQAGIKASVSETAIDDFLSRATTAFKVIAGVVTAVNENGTPRFSEKNAGQPLSPDEYAEGLQKTAPHLFKTNLGADAQGSGDLHTGPVKRITEAEMGDQLEDVASGKVSVPVPWGND